MIDPIDSDPQRSISIDQFKIDLVQNLTLIQQNVSAEILNEIMEVDIGQDLVDVLQK